MSSNNQMLIPIVSVSLYTDNDAKTAHTDVKTNTNRKQKIYPFEFAAGLCLILRLVIFVKEEGHITTVGLQQEILQK